MTEDEIMFGPVREPGHVSSDEQKAKSAARYAEKRAMRIAKGEKIPKGVAGPGRPKSIVNRVTEYGSLFNKLNQDRVETGLAPLKTAMEVLIDAMQSDEIELKDKAKIAEKLATFESSRAPIISIEHVQNISKEEEASADDALDDFLEAIRKS